MPIKRFSSIEYMPPPDRIDTSDPEAMRRVVEYYAELSRQLPPLFAPGLYKYRSIEVAGAAKEAAIIEGARKLRTK